MDLNLPDSSATEALGQALARSLPGAVRADAVPTGAAQAGAMPDDAVQTGAARTGAVLYLQGELGAGKTTCVRSLLRALGVAGLVRSPTYTLVETYPLATLTCVHVDLYRLQSLTEVDALRLRRGAAGRFGIDPSLCGRRAASRLERQDSARNRVAGELATRRQPGTHINLDPTLPKTARHHLTIA